MDERRVLQKSNGAKRAENGGDGEADDATANNDVVQALHRGEELAKIESKGKVIVGLEAVTGRN